MALVNSINLNNAYLSVAGKIGFGIGAMMNIHRAVVILSAFIPAFILSMTVFSGMDSESYAERFTSVSGIMAILSASACIFLAIQRFMNATEAAAFSKWLRNKDALTADTTAILNILQNKNGVNTDVKNKVIEKTTALVKFEKFSFSEFKKKAAILFNEKENLSLLAEEVGERYRPILDGAKATLETLSTTYFMFVTPLNLVCVISYIAMQI